MQFYDYSDNELHHHGILGMKWGRRKFQNGDGSLTKIGKDRHNPKIEKAKNDFDDSKKSYANAYKNYSKGTLTIKELKTAARDVDFSKKELSDAMIRAKMATQTKKSRRQEMFEQKYKERGLTQNEAEIAAYKRVRTEKIIAVTAGLTIAAATAYVAYKHYDNNVDKIIKSGTLLQNISTNRNRGVSDAFYASKDKLDNIKYRGILGNQLKLGPFGGMNNSVYETKIAVYDNLKVASKKSATQVLSELVKSNNAYAKSLEKQLTNVNGNMANPNQNKVIQEAIRYLKSGKINSKVYEALNLSLVDHGPNGKIISKGFYDQLKSKGYDAIKDINDSKYSGYKSSNPLIVFNGKTKTLMGKVRELGEKEINKNMHLGYADIFGKELVKTGAAYTTVILGGAGLNKTITNNRNNKIVSDYRKKHPGSTLSYNEIVRNYNQ